MSPLKNMDVLMGCERIYSEFKWGWGGEKRNRSKEEHILLNRKLT